MNRIIAGIDRAKQVIASKNLSEAKLKEVSASLDMDLKEYCMFQTRKSAAVGTKLTLEEANTIYGYLGNTPEHFNSQPLPVKWVLTEVWATLIKPA